MSKDGGPAFPFSVVTEYYPDGQPSQTMHTDGMSLRDYFAAAALNGMTGGVPGGHLVPPNAAKLAYEYADEMLKAREQ